MEFSEKQAARSKWRATQHLKAAHGRSKGRSHPSHQATLPELESNLDRYNLSDNEANADEGQAVCQSQGADLEQLLAESQQFYSQAHFRYRSFIATVDTEPPLVDVSALKQDLALDPEPLLQALSLLPLSELLGIAPQFLQNVNQPDLEAAAAPSIASGGIRQRQQQQQQDRDISNVQQQKQQQAVQQQQQAHTQQQVQQAQQQQGFQQHKESSYDRTYTKFLQSAEGLLPSSPSAAPATPASAPSKHADVDDAVLELLPSGGISSSPTLSATASAPAGNSAWSSTAPPETKQTASTSRPTFIQSTIPSTLGQPSVRPTVAAQGITPAHPPAVAAGVTNPQLTFTSLRAARQAGTRIAPKASSMSSETLAGKAAQSATAAPAVGGDGDDDLDELLGLCGAAHKPAKLQTPASGRSGSASKKQSLQDFLDGF